VRINANATVPTWVGSTFVHFSSTSDAGVAISARAKEARVGVETRRTILAGLRRARVNRCLAASAVKADNARASKASGRVHTAATVEAWRGGTRVEKGLTATAEIPGGACA